MLTTSSLEVVLRQNGTVSREESIMSSSVNAGYCAEQARKKSQEACKSKKSPDGKHEQVVASGSWPSVEYKCKYCGKRLGYSK